MPTQSHHLNSDELILMHTRIMTREGHLPESSPEQPLLCLGSITARSVFQVGDGEEESFFETTGVSLDVSGAL